ncbi:TonB-dependent receptor [Endozoicomonas arenosclerae]|uniref:TonB-dependent receptor n=1 Tax=Endozoicomonas arenosclerae TaxID=1633495 RepID=UPI00078126A9|nr:TonB-dependent receptor [Endozoicomonas arenosclerae]
MIQTERQPVVWQRTSLSILTAAIMTGLYGIPAQADSKDEKIEEVIVTANKREQSFQDYAGALQVMSGDDLEVSEIRHFDELKNYVPGLTFNAEETLDSRFDPVIRGVPGNDGSPDVAPSVGVYVDGVYRRSSVGNSMALLDIERVEVLKGPQGVLYGQNTLGGAINFVTRKPSKEWQGKASVTAGSYNLQKYAARASGPLIENQLGVRLAGQFYRQDSYLDNTHPGGDEAGKIKGNYAFMAGFLATPSDNLELDLTVDSLRNNSTPLAPASYTHPFYKNPAFAPFLPPVSGEKPYDVAVDSPLKNETDQDGISLKATWDVNSSWTFTSITSWRDTSNTNERDLDSTVLSGPLEPLAGYATGDTTENTVTQEFRLNYDAGDFWRTTSGIFFFDYNSKQKSDYRFFGQGGPVTSKTDTRQWAGFTNVELSIGERWIAEIGGRYSHLKRGLETEVKSDSGTFSKFTPALKLSYLVTPDSLIYASYTQGYRDGGYKVDPTDLSSINPFKEEVLDSYELGLNTQIGEDTTLRLTTFLYDYKDIQLEREVESGIELIVNAGKATNTGVELELKSNLTSQLTTSLNAALLKTRIDEGLIGKPGEQIDLKGNKFANAPRKTASWINDYRIPVNGFGTVNLRGEVLYTDEYFDDIENDHLIDGYTLFNASIVYQPSNASWDATLWVKNLTDKEYARNSGSLGVTYGAPRTVGVTFNYLF